MVMHMRIVLYSNYYTRLTSLLIVNSSFDVINTKNVADKSSAASRSSVTQIFSLVRQFKKSELTLTLTHTNKQL